MHKNNTHFSLFSEENLLMLWPIIIIIYFWPLFCHNEVVTNSCGSGLPAGPDPATI